MMVTLVFIKTMRQGKRVQLRRFCCINLISIIIYKTSIFLRIDLILVKLNYVICNIEENYMSIDVNVTWRFDT